ncbi:MAG: hypothetical protein D6818_05270 [Bacteroidetes bacterium]|nr:MAG: hypothetical protein D6818_05270 [Bacteroidota bacterium]
MLLLCAAALWTGCRKELIVIPDNEPPVVNNVPAIKIEHYVNRLFIDLLGREPLDDELAREVAALRAAELSQAARLALVVKLQSDTSWVEGDSSYRRAWSQHFYNLAKVRCLEGASDAEIRQFLNNATPDDSVRLLDVLASRRALELGQIQAHELFARMVYNRVYDQINMNTFNFVNATFDNLLWRYPTHAEFQAGFDMVEHGYTRTLFGEEGSSKDDYVQILTHSYEMFEGMIIWVYEQLLARRPTTEETIRLLPDFYQHRDIRKIQQAVLVTDEYAGF